MTYERLVDQSADNDIENTNNYNVNTTTSTINNSNNNSNDHDDDGICSDNDSETETIGQRQVLSTVNLTAVPKAAVVGTGFTLVASLLLYFITAESIDYLPALSETGIRVPGKYVFTAGLVLVAPFYLLLTLLVRLRLALPDVVESWSRNPLRLSLLRLLYSAFGFASVLFLVLLATITLEDSFVWHQVYAGIFFLSAVANSGILWAAVRPLYVTQNPEAAARKRNRFVMSLVAWFILPVVLTTAALSWCDSGNEDKFTTSSSAKKCWPAAMTAHAVCQYTLVATLMASVWTCKDELATLSIALSTLHS
eukprot:ANDGO_04150.mRNA.1 hypothetical protein